MPIPLGEISDGQFSGFENRLTLFAKGSGKNKILSWSIWYEGHYIYMESGTLGGETVPHSEPVEEGLASRTLHEQIISRIKSRVNKKKDSGYLESLEAAKSGERRNALGYKMPAKCAAYSSPNSIFNAPMLTGIQHKLNGHHANVVNDGGKLVMYSSNGKIIDTVPEILEGLEIPLGHTVEGEIYCHGIQLQTISSWIKRRQKDSSKLKYVMYNIDTIGTYEKRYADLLSIKSNDRCKVNPCDFVSGDVNLDPLMERALRLQYEGLVLYLPDYEHLDGKRSKGMIKVKPRHFKNFRVDDEFLVIDIKSSKDGWAILVCQTEDGKKFRVSCHGDVPYKTMVLENKHKFIGGHVRCEFESYTKSRVPFHPVSLHWREKFDE